MNEEKKNNKEKKKAFKGRFILFCFSVTFFAILIFFSMFGFVMPDVHFSESENRVLEQKPILTVQSFFDGSFMKKYETYLTDQFPLRDRAIYVKNCFERLLGKKEENGAYIGADGFIFDRQSPYNEKRMSEIASAINEFCKANPQLNKVFALSPNSSFVYGEKLPPQLVLENQGEQIKSFYGMLDSSINKVDAVSALISAKKEHQVFYRTDHHWTTRGAFAVFEELSKALKLVYTKDSYEFYNVSNKFRGTLSAKALSVDSSDSIELCTPVASEGTFFIDFYGEKEKSASFFFEDKLKQKNKYEVFLGGNYAKTSVTTTLEGDRKLIVIKDSFANCLIPMLTPYFTRILVLDPRYMTESVMTVIREDKFTDILFIYNANTLFEDTSLKTVLQ